MSLDLEVIEEAVLRIFADRQVPVGGQLTLEDLRAGWPESGLRRSDLVQGVRALVFDGELELDEESCGPVLILTPRGHERLLRQAPRSRGVWALLAPKKPAPASSLRRHLVEAGDGHGRRKSDQAGLP